MHNKNLIYSLCVLVYYYFNNLFLEVQWSINIEMHVEILSTKLYRFIKPFFDFTELFFYTRNETKVKMHILKRACVYIHVTYCPVLHSAVDADSEWNSQLSQLFIFTPKVSHSFYSVFSLTTWMKL